MTVEQVDVRITADTSKFYAELKKLSGLIKAIEANKVSFKQAQAESFLLLQDARLINAELLVSVDRASRLAKYFEIAHINAKKISPDTTRLEASASAAQQIATSLETANIAGDQIDANPSRLQSAASTASQIAGSLEAANVAGDQIDANAGRLEAAAVASGALATNLGAANVAGDGIGTKVGDVTKKVGLLAAGASVAGTALAGVLGFKAVQSASSLNEALNKNSVVFKEQAGDIEAWARQMQKMGQSTTQALGASSSFANLFQAFGVEKSGEEIAGMSKALTELGSDLGSFMDVPIEEVLAAFASGLSGETEPLKRFGIIATDVALRNTELAKSMDLPAGPLDPATKSLLIYQQILDSTTNAQGDYLRTFNSFPNLGRRIKATFTDSFASLGDKILPALTPVLEGFIGKIDPLIQSFAPVLESLAPLAGVFAEQLTGLVGVLAPVFASFISAITPVLALVGEELVFIIGELAPEFHDLLTAVAPLVIVFAKLFSSIAAPVLSVLMRALAPLAEIFTKIIIAAQPFIDKVMSGLAQVFGALIPILEAFAQPILDAIIPALEILQPVFEEMFNAIIDLLPQLTPIFEQLGEVFGAVMIQLALATADLLPLLIDAFKQIVPALLPLIPALLDLVMAFVPLIPLMVQMTNLILPVFLNLMILLAPVLETIVKWLSSMFSWIAEKIAPVVQEFVDKHGEDLKNTFNGISSAVKTVVDWIAQLWNRFEEIIPQIANFVTSVANSLSNFGSTVWNAMATGFNLIKDNITSWVTSVTNIFAAIGNAVVSGVRGPLNLLIGGFNSIINGFNKVNNFVGLSDIGLIPEFHTGGVIGGGGKLRPAIKRREDEQLIMALKGEGVLPQDAMRTWGPEMFEMMRAGDRTGLMKALLDNGTSKKDVLSLDYDKMFATASQGDGVGGFLKGLVSDVFGAFGIELPDVGSLFGDSAGRLFEIAKKYLTLVVEKFKQLIFDGGNFNVGEAGGYRSDIANAAGKPGSWHSLVAYLEALNVPHVVTSTFRPFAVTASGNRSLHAQNRAVDLAPPGGGVDNAGLGRIFWAFQPVFDLLTELIYAGPQTGFNIKNRQRVAKYAEAIHHNHVHAAAEKGGIVRGSAAGKLILAGERNRDEAILPLNDRPRTRQILKDVGLDSNSVKVEGSTFVFNNQASPKHVASIITDYFDKKYMELGF